MTGVPGPVGVEARRSAATTEAPWLTTSSRRSRQAVETASSRRRNCAFGKYVPQKNGSPSGVANTVIGQPPWPVIAWVAVM